MNSEEIALVKDTMQRRDLNEYEAEHFVHKGMNKIFDLMEEIGPDGAFHEFENVFGESYGWEFFIELI